MKNIFYFKLDSENNPVAGSLLAFTSKPPEGRWIRLGGEYCCSQFVRTSATVSGVAISTAVAATITLSCVGVANPARTVVPLTVGNTVAVKRAAVLAATHDAYDSVATITSDDAGVSIYATGINCPDGTLFTIVYS